MSDRREGHTTTPNHRYTYFFQNKIFKITFWALSRGPRSFCPSFSNSSTPAAYPQIFSDVSTPNFHPCLYQALPDWTKPAPLYSFFSFSPKSMSDRRECHTTYYISRGPRGFCPSFSNSPTPATYPHIFSPNLDLNSHYLLHSTAKRLNYTLIRPSCTTPRDARPVGRTIHGPHSPLDAWEPNHLRHPYAPPLLVL